MLELTKALKEKCASLNLRYVPPSGSPSSKFWIVGEAPGEEEDKALQPFVGKSGGFLNAGMRAVGISRENCYIDNISPIRPPANSFYRLGEVGVQPGECIDAFREKVETFRPNVVFALGAIALSTLTDHEEIRPWRGYLLNYKGIKVVASFHPSFILHKLQEKSARKERETKGGIKYTYGSGRMTFLLDLKRAKEESAFPQIVLPVRNLIYGLDEFAELRWLGILKVAPELGVDVETGFNGTITHLSLSNLNSSVSFSWSRPDVLEGIRKILATHQGLVLQNAMFDAKKLKIEGFPIGRIRVDTMICHNLLYPEWPHGLDYLSSIYEKLDYPPHGPGWNLAANIGRSNALHSFLTLSIWKKLEKELKEIQDARLL